MRYSAIYIIDGKMPGGPYTLHSSDGAVHHSTYKSLTAPDLRVGHRTTKFVEVEDGLRLYYSTRSSRKTVIVPETHPLFNLSLGIADKVKLPPSDIFNNLRKMTAVYVDRLLEKLNTNR